MEVETSTPCPYEDVKKEPTPSGWKLKCCCGFFCASWVTKSVTDKMMCGVEPQSAVR